MTDNDLTFGDEDYELPDVERRICPSCGTNSRIITRGDSRATIVSKCCEAPLSGTADDQDDEPAVLVLDGKLVCPYADCSATDEIVELDVATRSNELTIIRPGVISVALGDSCFENDGFECEQCSRRVSLPDGYELSYP
ncbi:hypothetical protein SAMN05421874_128118 [Nonomuraea maritima]|uniref:Uncharacterized protein n=1 Tax=Nonomuraea maritima TaxID=683260 RepID=A0A1G9MPC4_9ACTN|nr:hypothetical protein [Nonomuraea maritima]SDL75861.1 hypothetical protein SAMN05421874_128118 [Nonomuraea maritima]